MGVEKYCNGDYLIICICEGTAEEDVINWLLDEDLLLFSRDELVGKTRGKLTRTRKANKIESEILSYDFDKDVVIFRIIDSKNEKFELGNLYKERHDVVNYITNPEIEILMISKCGELDKYTRKFSRQKPNEYAKEQYKVKKIKSKGTFYDFFEGDINLLIGALREHKSKKGKGHLTIYDLLTK
ncbi:MAG: hypothetical protein U9N10_06710 [Bacillota bacterium]|nr:hypothetical protein [Bacillota bacterium]